MTTAKNLNPLVFYEIPDDTTTYKNTAPYEAENAR